jgi:drug/metabolite transporter (DMT)-like permease
VLAAWVLVGESITAVQALGGVIVLSGLALARQGDRSEVLADATWPDGPLEERPPVPANG